MAPCPDGMVVVSGEIARQTGHPFCVDTHEAPGRGKPPTLGLALSDAEAACLSRGVRLCTPAEWTDACAGPGGTAFPYGGDHVTRKCNTRGREIAPGGSFPECMSASGAFDMSGNAAEWTAGGEVRGASALDGERGRCAEKRGGDVADERADIGFRCCADPLAPTETTR